jgi:hypothetical protein
LGTTGSPEQVPEDLDIPDMLTLSGSLSQDDRLDATTRFKEITETGSVLKQPHIFLCFIVSTVHTRRGEMYIPVNK